MPKLKNFARDNVLRQHTWMYSAIVKPTRSYPDNVFGVSLGFSSQASQKQANHRDLDERLTALHLPLVAFAHPPVLG
jgi:hypothetical protein